MNNFSIGMVFIGIIIFILVSAPALALTREEILSQAISPLTAGSHGGNVAQYLSSNPISSRPSIGEILPNQPDTSVHPDNGNGDDILSNGVLIMVSNFPIWPQDRPIDESGRIQGVDSQWRPLYVDRFGRIFAIES